MKIWYFLVAVVVFALAAVVLAKLQARRASVASYRSRKPLSDAEQTLFWRLREAMPECVILSQVAFSRFLEPVGSSARARRSLFYGIAQKSVDFLVCLPDFTLVAAIELDDKSHRPARDARRDSILAMAGVPIIRLHVRDIPSAEQLRLMFTK